MCNQLDCINWVDQLCFLARMAGRLVECGVGHTVKHLPHSSWCELQGWAWKRRKHAIILNINHKKLEKFQILLLSIGGSGKCWIKFLTPSSPAPSNVPQPAPVVGCDYNWNDGSARDQCLLWGWHSIYYFPTHLTLILLKEEGVIIASYKLSTGDLEHSGTL